MAITGPLLILSIFSSLLLLPSSSSSSAATTTAFSGDVHHTDGFARARSVDRRAFGLKKEKLSHLHFYWHDVQSGPRPSSVTVVPAPSNSSATFFGLINMIDNALTMRPEPNSTLVGRSQGLYASASQEYVGLLMVMNFAFLEGKYNGSTVTVLGRNPVFNPMREMAVIGGSGLFRFARGYAQASTHAFDPSSGDAVVEYNVYVLHY